MFLVISQMAAAAMSMSSRGILFPRLGSDSSCFRSGDQLVCRQLPPSETWTRVLGEGYGILEELVVGIGPRRSRRIVHTNPRASLEKGKPQRPSLGEICLSLHRCFFEICVQNLGRPAAKALHEFVRAAVSAFMAGYTCDKLALELAYGVAGVDDFKEGYRLTASEEQYRTQWLDTIYVTMQLLKVVDNEAARAPATDNRQLCTDGKLSVNDADGRQRVLEGQRTGEEQSFVKFDRGLATKGASGGVIAEKQVIAPQWIPVSQLVLLTLKVVKETI